MFQPVGNVTQPKKHFQIKGQDKKLSGAIKIWKQNRDIQIQNSWEKQMKNAYVWRLVDICIDTRWKQGPKHKKIKNKLVRQQGKSFCLKNKNKMRFKMGRTCSARVLKIIQSLLCVSSWHRQTMLSTVVPMKLRVIFLQTIKHLYSIFFPPFSLWDF